jgi:hypothetical protein
VAGGDWFDGGGVGAHLELSELLVSSALDAIVRVAGTGALVSIGLSRDGGALAVTVTADGRWRREWFREADHLVEWLAGAEEAAAAALRTDPASGGQGRGSGGAVPPVRRKKTL